MSTETNVGLREGIADGTTGNPTESEKVSKRQSFTLEKFKQHKAKPKPELLIVHSFPNLVKIKRAIGQEPELDLDSQSKTTFHALAVKETIHKKIGYISRVLARNPNEKVSEWLVYAITSFATDRKNNPITELFETVGMDRTAEIIVTYDNNNNELPPKLGVEQDLFTIPFTGKEQIDSLLSQTGQSQEEIQWILKLGNTCHGKLTYDEMSLPLDEIKSRVELGVQGIFPVTEKLSDLSLVERLKLKHKQ